MADTQTNSPLGRRSGKKKTTVAGLVIAVLIGGYTMFRPAINQATGWDLPAISNRDAQPRQDVQAAQKTEKNSDSGTRTSDFSPTKTGTTQKQAKPGPLASRMSPSKSAPSATAKSSGNPPAASSPSSDSDSSLKYGLLQEVSRDRFMSPEGLLYTPGSAEGHRLEHLKRHTVDQPSRPGKHGVFDGGMEGALKSIEKAYQKAKADQRTSKKVDGNRTIYTVDMGKRIGFIGGREGNQKRKPMARRLRMVLEGNRVITAYPF